MSRGHGYRWYCPGNRERGQSPWCRSLPCHGHWATADQVMAAKVLAWADGTDWDDAAQRSMLTTARLALHDLGYPLGRLR